MKSDFKEKVYTIDRTYSRRVNPETLQVNLGNRCNQQCAHCHVDASPSGAKIMSKEVMGDIVIFLSKKKDLILDVTGGCPELNPNFKYFIEKAKPHAKEIKVRSNLTVLLEPGMEGMAQFYKDQGVHLVCSMPCYTRENVDKQRGEGVFDKSIKALRILNELGYGKEENLVLDLVYNPGGAVLPGEQSGLERDYKKVLKEKYQVTFSYLLTITNAPIKRFEQYLKANGNFDKYMKLLMDNFNENVAGNIMCRKLLSVGWDGTLYDCDFNQALNLSLKDKSDKTIKVSDISPDELQEREIIFENHCYCCTAGAGSSCEGALKK
ncbi:MAG: arsenosugar biosynthesis radical SAM protein ArsS [Candidatus Omnitrophica bacterium]|nr:arsenosugar biosynthesis radical SAM protein ArsS [Candidatus Omnitrophota bacterium]